MNVAVYARGASAWALREGPLDPAARGAAGVAIGASSMRWEGDRIIVDVDERTTPLRGAPRPVRGRIVLHPEARTDLELSIDERGEHRWWPAAPLARIEVDLPWPGVRFRGHGYYDANAGARPLESAFESWHWSRARGDGALLTYDVACTSGASHSLAFRVSSRGEIDDLERVHTTRLARTFWALPRRARVDRGHGGRVVRTLEDGPFYARALVETRLGGRPVLAMHETLAPHRLRRDWVQRIIGARMRQTV